jgi:hypothetical protein
MDYYSNNKSYSYYVYTNSNNIINNWEDESIFKPISAISDDYAYELYVYDFLYRLVF